MTKGRSKCDSNTVRSVVTRNLCLLSNQRTLLLVNASTPLVNEGSVENSKENEVMLVSEMNLKPELPSLSNVAVICCSQNEPTNPEGQRQL